MKKHIIITLLLIATQNSFGQNTVLWKVTDTINNKTSTIMGTFHQFGNSFVDSIPEIKEKLLVSNLAVFESIDKVSQTQKMLNSREKSDEIKKGIKKKDYQKLLELSKNWTVNLHKLKPIELSWKLHQEFIKTKCKTVMKNDKWDHLDNYLQHLAEENKIKTIGLETDKDQLSLINKKNENPDWKNERKRINYLVEQLTSKDFDKNKCMLAEKYRNYDLDYKLNEECPTNIFLTKRNDNWMSILPQLLKENTCFIAVGLFHLYNKCGLLEQLKNKGFLIEPIKLTNVYKK